MRYRSIARFYKWLVAEGERRDDPMQRIPAPRIPQTLQPHYTAEEVRRVLAPFSPTSRDPLILRDRAIILTLFDTGVRGAELCGAELEDLDLRQFTIAVRQGKAGKQRRVAVGAVTAQAIERYTRRRPVSPWLFASKGGENLTFNALRNMLRRSFLSVGLDFRGVHAFRRGFAISFLDAGGDPGDLQALAGWESVAMVRRYARATETERAIRAHKQFSPVQRLGLK